jgi:hypothetical protein
VLVLITNTNHEREPRLLYRNGDIEPGPAAYDSRDVAPSPRIVGQHDVSRTEASHGSVADFDLRFSRERNHILAPGRRMPLLNVAGLGATKDDALSRLQFFVLYFNLLEMGMAVCAAIESGKLHDLSL